MPKVRSKKFMACFNSATDEKETIETVRQVLFTGISHRIVLIVGHIQLVSASVKDLIRSGIPLSVFGRQLIHVRVRARTNNISQDLIREIVADMESDSTDMNKKESTGRSGKSFDNVYSKEYVNPSTSLPTAKKLNEPKKLQISRLPCVGTVTLYCPSLQEHFVIFDAAHLQPQWVSFLKNEVELILGTDDAAETTVAVLNGIKAHESSLILLNNHRLQRQADKKNVLSIKARLESFAIENDNKKAVQKDPVAKPVKKNGYRKGQRRWKKHTKDKKSDSSCKEVDHSQTIDSDEEGSENGDNIDIDEDKQVQEQSVSSSMVDRNEEDVLGADGNSKEESLVVEDELAHPEYSAVECFLCGGLETNPKAACSMGFLVSCGECEQWVHSYCMPSSKFPELNVLKAQRNKTIHTRSCVSGAEDGRTWLCWRCIGMIESVNLLILLVVVLLIIPTI